MKILWCITGAGHLLKETVRFMGKFSEENEIVVAFSNAGLEVVRVYRIYEKIKRITNEIILEKDQCASYPLLGRLVNKEFEKILVMPCSANTTAKIAHGITDSLITNLIAQGVKNMIPVVIFPTDFRKTERTTLPNGKVIQIHIRDIDIKNANKVSKMQSIKVVRNFEEIR